MKVAIILLNYNSSADCRKCIGFLKNQKDVDLEIIVVDNGSRTEEVETVEELCREKGCTFIAVKENRGYNAGNNIGLRYAYEKGYEYALIANPDMEFPNPLYLSTLVSVMQKDPEIVVAGTDIVTPEGVHQNPMLADGNWTTSFGWIKDVIHPRKKDEAFAFVGDSDKSGECAKLSGCALMIRVDFAKEMGFFDEYPFLYCEEAILSKQVKHAKKKMHYEASIQAVHRHIPSTKGDPRPRFRHWRRSRLYYTRKYSDYPWYGRIYAIFSWRLYFWLLNSILVLRKIIKS